MSYGPPAPTGGYDYQYGYAYSDGGPTGYGYMNGRDYGESDYDAPAYRHPHPQITYAESGRDGSTSYANAGLASWQAEQHRGDVFFAKSNVDHQKDTINASTGFIDFETNVGNFGIDHKVLSLGVETGRNGTMVCPTVVDGTVHLGPVDVNYGVGYDTGLLIDNGIEAKFLGNGFSISDRGADVCIASYCTGIKKRAHTQPPPPPPPQFIQRVQNSLGAPPAPPPEFLNHIQHHPNRSS